jgi:hypothetical protein
MPKTKKNGKDNSKTGRITKEQAKKFLAPVPEQNVFWCNDGNVLRDIRQLGEALAMMSDQTFSYHSNGKKKDFSKWIRDVVGDEKLAQALELAPDREQAAGIVEKRCSQLISKAG